jgi:hypothetical protein
MSKQRQKQCPVGFDPYKFLTIGNEHCQKHDPVQGQVVYLCVMALQEILNKLVDWKSESLVSSINSRHTQPRALIVCQL